MNTDPLPARGPSQRVDGHLETAQGLRNSTTQMSSLGQEMCARHVKSRCTDCEGIKAQGSLCRGSLPRGTCSSCCCCTTIKIPKGTRCLRFCYGKARVRMETVSGVCMEASGAAVSSLELPSLG